MLPHGRARLLTRYGLPAEALCFLGPILCFDEHGELEDEAQRILNTLRSFTEISVSGSGLHIVVKAKLPGDSRHPAGIGLFDHARYFIMSGNHYPGASFKIEERQAEIEELYAELFLTCSP